jgi:hypothetical protein
VQCSKGKIYQQMESANVVVCSLSWSRRLDGDAAYLLLLNKVVIVNGLIRWTFAVQPDLDDRLVKVFKFLGTDHRQQLGRQLSKILAG